MYRCSNRSRSSIHRTTETFVAPDKKDPVPHLNFAPLQNAVDRLQKSAEAFDKARMGRTTPFTGETRAALNKLLYQTERTMTDKDGLPRRNWFRHQIYAPGYYTGYGVKTLPAVREAIEQREWAEAERQIERVGGILAAFADSLAAGAAP